MDEVASSAISGEDLLCLKNIKALEKETSLHRLQPAVVIGLTLLEEIAASFGKAEAVPEIAGFIRSIEDIKGCIGAERVIIGVVGSTGAGKSSVINALLDEECLAPTNYMRACTAVVTEIQYNDSTDPASKYKAEVEFISKNDLVEELEVCLDEFRNGDKRDYESLETEAGVAFHKIRAIFPHLAMDDLLDRRNNAESMASHQSLTAVLGGAKYVEASEPQALLDQVRQYIDSSDKRDGEPAEMEYWPLVKVVKVFVRNPILQTGLVIVDLPGVQDCNAARSAVAAKYIQNCSGLWVVAPITRAVDDKTAHNLLGTTFRRQMQFDGAYGHMSFICSKIDDVSITEAMKCIKEKDPRHPAHARDQALQNVQKAIKNLTAILGTADMDHKNLLDQIRDCDISHHRITQAIIQAHTEDEVLLRTPSPKKKRKARESAETPQKRVQLAAIDSDSDTCQQDSDDDEEGDSVEEPSFNQEILTREDARRRAEEIRAGKKALEKLKKASNTRKKDIRNSLKDAKAEEKMLESQIKSDCVQYRNEYSMGQIQKHFADGVKEMDVDIAMCEDEHDEGGRDYAALAANLPVFCVSSRAYQKMSGRLEKDENLDGFPNIENTGIPGLQRHALKIIQSTRVIACRRFLNELRRYLMSLMMQVVISQQPLKLADEMRQQELEFLEESLEVLSKKFGDSVNNTLEYCQRKARSRIYQKFDGAITTAFNKATEIVESWGGHPDKGGLRFMTYRATCAKKGVFKGSRGFRDLNEELTAPLKKEIAKAWESVCTRHIPDKLRDLATDLVEHLGVFIASMKQRKNLQRSKSYGLVLAKLLTFVESLEEATPLINLALEGQKEANRVFTPAITRAMVRAYARCKMENGPGSYNRMKGYMSQHVEAERSKMYATATEGAKEGLDKMMEDLQETVENKLAHIIAVIREDFGTLVADRNVFKALGDVKESIEELLGEADTRFNPVFDTPDQVHIKAENAGENMPERMESMSIDEGGAEGIQFDSDILRSQVGV